MRIISTVPSITELLFDLELDEYVVGITKFCIHPEEWFRTKTRIGGTKSLNLDAIRALNPTLIIANKEENTKEDIEACMAFCEVYVNDVSDYHEALEMIMKVGSLTNRLAAAEELILKIESAFSRLGRENKKRESVMYVIWKDPIMTVGGDTFISDMMEKAGWQNLFSGEYRYPQVTEEKLSKLRPDALFLSSEPYPFSEKHIPYFQNLLPGTKIMTVNGEPFSWYGSRMLRAPAYFQSIKI